MRHDIGGVSIGADLEGVLALNSSRSAISRSVRATDLLSRGAGVVILV
jgi:hypothetical protein